MLAMLILAGVAMAEEPENWERERWGGGGLPALNYNSDEGFGFGVVASAYRYNGEVAPYKTAINLVIFATTFGIHNHSLEVDTLQVGDRWLLAPAGAANPAAATLSSVLQPAADAPRSRLPQSVALPDAGRGLPDARALAPVIENSMAGGAIYGDQKLAGTGMSSFEGGATGWYRLVGAASPGEQLEITYAIFDMGDSAWDTIVLLDNWRWNCEGCVPSDDDACGVQPQ